MSILNEQILDMIEDLGLDCPDKLQEILGNGSEDLCNSIADFITAIIEEIRNLGNKFQSSTEVHNIEDYFPYIKNELDLPDVSDTSNLQQFLECLHALLSELQFARYSSVLTSDTKGGDNSFKDCISFADMFISYDIDEEEEAVLDVELSEEESKMLIEINDLFEREMETRRRTALKRLDVSVQSCVWKVEEDESEMVGEIEGLRRLLSENPLKIDQETIKQVEMRW